MIGSKYEGIILEGRWKFVKWEEKNKVLLENIYNGQTVIIHNQQFQKALNGQITISKIICLRLNNSYPHSFYTNNVVAKSKKQRQKYATEKK